jgi:GNAT superfamily N-acetyltransferase
MDRVSAGIRPMTAADAEAVAALHTASWQSAYRRVLDPRWLDERAAADRRAHWAHRAATSTGREAGVVVEVAGVLEGFAYLIADADPSRGTLLDNLHVRPDRRGDGLGRRLIAAALRMARARDWPPGLHLWVFEANGDARRFYERHGGRVVERVLYAAADGAVHPSLCYHWDAAAATRLAADSAATAAGAP